MNVLVTGATGFIGRKLIEILNSSECFTPLAAIRKRHQHSLENTQAVLIDGLGADTVWHEGLKNIQVVIHAAARVHVMQDNAKDPLAEFRKINVEGTLNLARQAADASVKRFIFISSIKVNGEFTLLNETFLENDKSEPVDPYGISKCETELALFQLSKETGMEVVCIRPPLVYGPGVKANFLSMMKWLHKGIPLPFGAIQNKRSLIFLDNLVDLIVTCIKHPAAANQIFLVSDGEDLSTTELLNKVSMAMNKRAILIPVPHGLLEYGFKLMGKADLAQRLCSSLCIDISKSREMLGWSPAVSVDEGINKTVKYFIDSIDKV